MTIGDIIKQKRLSLGLTLNDVGEAVGVTKATVSRWESGDIRHLKRDKIALLAGFLGIDPVILDSSTEVLSPAEHDLIDAYRAADDRARADALNTLKSHPKH